jgi:peptidoglycan/xylan/chitin deacetylase (PgdA/CDA1 family)
MHNIKRLISLFAYSSGLARYASSVNKQHSRIPILMYHSICDNSKKTYTQSCLMLRGMSVTSKSFAAHIHHISKRYTVIGLDDLVSFIAMGRKLPNNPLVLTFDDGYRDNYINAKPILEKYGFKAAFFPIGNVLAGKKFAWPYTLYRLIDLLFRQHFTITIEGFPVINVEHPEKTRELLLATKLRDYISNFPMVEREAIVDTIAKANSIQDEELYGSNAFMNLTELQELDKQGHIIGSHTMSHDALIRYTPQELIAELVKSKEIIAPFRHTGLSCFAYPFGSKQTFNDGIKHSIKSAGFDCAVSTVEGLNDATTDLYELRRIEIGNYNIWEFEAHVSGAIALLKRKLQNR